MKDERKDIENELSEIAPFLAKLKEDNIPIETFRVPDDYFDNLSNTIFEKTIFQEESVIQQPTIATKESVWANLGRYFQWLWNPGTAVVLTSVVVLVIAGFYLVNQPINDYGSNLTAADIEQYVEENIETFELEQLAELTVVSESKVVKTTKIPVENSIQNAVETPIETPVKTEAIDNIEIEDLEQYIEENYIDDLDVNDLM